MQHIEWSGDLAPTGKPRFQISVQTTTLLGSIGIRYFATSHIWIYALLLYPLIIRTPHNNQKEEAIGYLSYKNKYLWTGCMTCKKYIMGDDNLYWNVALLVVVKS